jgi:hypothetical protein
MDLIPGFIQGIVRVLVSYPFDYIRTNIQSQQYRSGLEFIKRVKLSPLKAYNGVSIPLCTVPFDRAINFYIFEECKKKEISSIFSSIISASLCSFYFVPLNFFSTKLVLTNSSVKNTFNNFKQLNSLQFYKGFTPDIIRNMSGSILFMSCYGTLRDNTPIENHNYMLFGVCSSIFSWIFTYPLDTLRILKQNGSESYINLIRNNYKYSYKGFSYILMRSVPSAGAGMSAYEYTKKHLANYA